METSPGCWDISAAGHASTGDDSITCAIRETKEELGIKLTPDKFILIGTVSQSKAYPERAYFNNEINDVYLVKLDLDLSSLKLQKEEVDAVKYIPTQELKKWVAENRKDLVSHPDEYKLLFEYLSKNK